MRTSLGGAAVTRWSWLRLYAAYQLRNLIYIQYLLNMFFCVSFLLNSSQCVSFVWSRWSCPGYGDRGLSSNIAVPSVVMHSKSTQKATDLEIKKTRDICFSSKIHVSTSTSVKAMFCFFCWWNDVNQPEGLSSKKAIMSQQKLLT